MADFDDSPINWDDDPFEDNQDEIWYAKHHMMFLIDTSAPMFGAFAAKSNVSKSYKTTFFSTSVEICKSVVMKLIRKGRNDKVGVMLYGTNSNNRTCPKYLNVICEPKKPSIELIKLLDDLVLADETKYGHSPLAPLPDAIWYSNYLLNKFKENQCCNTIVLLTCDDRPNVGDSKKQFNLRKRLGDAVKNNVDFKLIPIGATFNFKTFYEGFLDNFNNISKPLLNGFENIDDIMLEIDGKRSHGRSVASIKFFIDDANYMFVSLFSFYTKSKIPPKVKLDKITNKPLKSVNRMLVNNVEPIDKSDLAKYCTIAEKNIIFNDEDILTLKMNIFEPGCKLLGFTNKSNLSTAIDLHFKTSMFIQPNNEIVEDSALFFNSLLEGCLETNKIALCLIKMRNGGRIHFAALSPQREFTDKYGVQQYPSGFHVMFLAFSECSRSVKPQPFDDLSKITNNQLSISKTICEKMLIDYRPTMFKNPKLNFHWALLEALALELKPPNILDETLSMNEVIDKKLSTIKNDIITQFPANPTAGPTKRGTTNYNKNFAKKKK